MQDHALNEAVAKFTRKFEGSADEAESFCDMLAGWLEQHKHWRSNEHAADLMNGIEDLISDCRHSAQREREDAGQDALDTAREARRESREG